MTTLNYWHYIVFSFSLVIFSAGVFLAIREDEKESKIWIVISFFIVSVIVAGFGLYAVDKLTKIAKISRLTSKRLLSREQVMYSGVVRNEGNHEIGEVTLEIKLVNKSFASGSMSSGVLFEQGSIVDFFVVKKNQLLKPQQVLEEFVVAKDLKAGESEEFVVYMTYPPYFGGSTEYTKVYAH